MPLEKVRLKLLRHWKCFKPGDVVSVPAGIMPERMLRNKTAERYFPKSSKKKKEISENGGDSNSNSR